MKALKTFEMEVVRTLLSGTPGLEDLGAVLEEAREVSFEHTGVGYFLTVRHPEFPVERLVCGDPPLMGLLGDLECGFVVFLERNELTLECYTWNDGGLPRDFREQEVRVTRSP
jgi:hypothetical protein